MNFVLIFFGRMDTPFESRILKNCTYQKAVLLDNT